MTRLNREALYHRLDQERRKRRCSWAAIARENGFQRSLFTSLGQHNGITADNFLALLTWLGEHDVRPYLTDEAA